jgi:CheY-like chemotaxis protein
LSVTSIRESLGTLLTASGYEVVAANNGFDALLQLKRTSPDVIISDLNMPEMSGLEFLSVVRRRFPQIPVVAISGAYDQWSDVPGGVIADAFCPKGQHPKMLLATVADLIRTSVERSNAHRRESAPVWIPRNGKDSHGKPFIVLTCTFVLIAILFNPIWMVRLSTTFSLWLDVSCLTAFAALLLLKSQPTLSIPSITDKTPGSESL